MLRPLPLLLIAVAISAGELPYGHADFRPTPDRPIGWRGDYTGGYPGATPTLSWDVTTGANVRWKLSLPGVSNAEPVVVGDLVITTAEPHHLIAVDLKSGRIRWQTVVNPMEYLPGTTPQQQAKYLEALPVFTRIEEIRIKHHISSNRAIPESALNDLKEGWRLLREEFAKLDAIGLDGMPSGLPIPSLAEIDALVSTASDAKHPFNKPYKDRVTWFPKKYGFSLVDV